ncbi:NRAMP metal ion transporter family protein [Actinidia rufa]|uniref:NRAMP metal ion transporter family protein n=1 Tax=Actinidia rufa TaxID=165716 RepID=A0A7J0G7Y0_9ERIC|nr:NRAMP metal ion transporter family protein [Actinidia rufa]
MLPSSVIPFFWVASSRSVIGVYKVSYFVEFFALIMFIGILGLKIIFLVEMMFGNCDWAVRLGWDVGSISLSYIVLLITVSTLLCLMIWLAATPLKSASSRLDARVWNWDINDVPDLSAERHERHYSKTRYGREESTQKQEPSVALGNSLESHPNVLPPNSDLNLPETLLDVDTIPYMTTIGDNDYNITFPSPTSYLEESSTPVETGVSVGKVRMVGSGAGSLSRLAGLGCAARRQLTVVLDDFWGQLFDFHGQAIQEAKATRLDVLLGVDSKFDPKPTTPLKVDANVKEFTGYFPSIGGKGSDSPMNSSIYDSPNLLGVQEMFHCNLKHHFMIFALLAGPAENLSNALNTKKFHSLPDISGIFLRYRESGLSDRNAQWDGTIRYGTSSHSGNSLKVGSPLAFDNLSPPKPYSDPLTLFSSRSNTGSLWSKQSFEQFGLSDKIHTVGNKKSSITSETNDGADEDLIDRVTAKERFLYEAEAREMNRLVHMVEPQYSLDRKPGSALKNDDIDYSNFLVSSVPHCRDGYVWRMDLTISFGVWCNHRILDLSLMESRPELWGKIHVCASGKILRFYAL